MGQMQTRWRLVAGAVCLVSLAGLMALGMWWYKCARRPAIQHNPVAFDLDPDNDPGALEIAEMRQKLGLVPTPRRPYRVGVVLKYFGNQYWQLVARGMEFEAQRRGIILMIHAGSSETDPEGQAQALERLLDGKLDAVVIAPQTATNLATGVARARAQGVPVVSLVEAGDEGVEFLVGARQCDIGACAARFMLGRHPQDSEFAVVAGPDSAYAARQRTRGFRETLPSATHPIVEILGADWNQHEAMVQTNGLLQRHPQLTGIYCNNDNMALGALEAVRRAGREEQVTVVGTDGIAAAIEAVEKGLLGATIDSFPEETGLVATEVVARVLGGQRVPRVVYSPQHLVVGPQAGIVSEGGHE